MNSTTEAASKRYAMIEDWPASDLVEGIVEGQFAAIAAVSAASTVIAAAAEAICKRLESGGRLVYCGAGTSGRLATLDAAELPPTYNFPRDRAISLMAGGKDAFLVAREGAEDDEVAAVTDLKQVDLTDKDVLIGVAASGNTPYVLAGLDYARSLGSLTVAVFNNKTARAADLADYPILLATGAEFVAGSTRMKAGTAQKVALNTLSTAVMIRLGYVYKGRMIEMRPTNAKLHQRAKEMVAELAGTDLQTAEKTLAEAGDNIKTAIMMLKKTCDRMTAEKALAAAKGNLRRALEG